MPTLLAKSMALDDWIWTKIADRGMPANLRNRLAGAAFTTALYHHLAILRLLDVKLFPAAYALARILFEAGVTGLWIENCATDDELTRLSRAEWNPTIDRMIQRNEKVEGFDSGIISLSKCSNWRAMNDYTHCRGRMLQRMIEAEYIGVNFPSDEFQELLGFSSSWALFSMLGIARMCNDLPLQNEILKKCEEFVSSSDTSATC